MDLAPPPGLEFPSATCQVNYTHQVPSTHMEQWSWERTCHEMSILAAIRNGAATPAAPLKVYPLMPPGVFKQPCDTFSAASTAASETSEDNDEIPEIPRPLFSTQPAEEMKEARKEFSRELQVEPQDKTQARPLKVHWPVDSRKLSSRDKQIISPTFEVSPGCLFKLMLKPKAMGDKKYQEGFQRARGWGSVELKCVEGASSAPMLRFWISVGDEKPRSSVTHDFSEIAVSGMAKSEESFHFASAVDKDSGLFLVSLQAITINPSAPAGLLD